MLPNDVLLNNLKFKHTILDILANVIRYLGNNKYIFAFRYSDLNTRAIVRYDKIRLMLCKWELGDIHG